MSKKDRLKAQSEKQIQQKRDLEKVEQLEKSKSENKISKSAVKLRKQYSHNDNWVMMLLKILMIVPFGYSAFFYGGVTILGITMGEINDIPKRIAVLMGVGIVLCLAGIFFVFFRKYIVQFVLVAAGSLTFLYQGQFIIDNISKKLETNYVEDEAIQVLDKTYMIRYYPILAMLLISAILLGIYIAKVIIKKRKIQKEKDNAPVESIVAE